MTNQRIGIIDVGSNTVRLVIFEIDNYYSIIELQNIKTPARLVQYLDDENHMSQEGIDVLIQIMRSFREISIRYNIDALLPVATQAIRQAKNASEIVQQITAATDIEMRILSEKEEAYFGNYAVRHTMHYTDGLTVDIGGASTELTLFKNKEVLHSHSFPFGVVTLKRKFFEGKEHNDPKAIKKAQKFVEEQFKTLDWVPKAKVPLIGVGGSARNIGEIHQRQIHYPIAGIHSYEMNREELETVFELLKNTTLEEKEDLDGLSEDRRDIIIPAGIVFTTLYDTVKADCFALSNRGLREGIVMDYLNREFNNPFSLHDLQKQTIERTARKYGIRPLGSRQRVAIADKLFTVLNNEIPLTQDPYLKKLMRFGAYLYFLGSYIEDDSESQHTFYILSNSNLHGFNHKDRVRLALLASFKNKSLFNQYSSDFLGWFSDEELSTLMYLGGIIKFSEALNDSHVNIVRDIHLEPSENNEEYDLYVTYTGDVLSERYRSNKQKNHIERILDKSVTVHFTDEPASQEIQQ